MFNMIDIAYLSLLLENSNSSASTETILKPYLDAIISLSKSSSSPSVNSEAILASDPLFTMYYTQHPTLTPTPATSNTSPTILVSPPIPYDLAECADAASTAAESLFLRTVEVHKARHPEAWVVGTTGDKEVGSGGDVFEEIKAFWPPLDGEPDEEVEEW